MKLSREEVTKIADLARIRLDERMIDATAEQLSSILNYVGKLSEVDTANTDPISQVHGYANMVREDEVKNGRGIADDTFREAPAKKGRLITVFKEKL